MFKWYLIKQLFHSWMLVGYELMIQATVKAHIQHIHVHLWKNCWIYILSVHYFIHLLYLGNLKKYCSLSSETFQSSVREGAFFGSLIVWSYRLYSSTKSCITQISLFHNANSACQNLKIKRNFIEIFVPCFFFHNKLFKTSWVIHLLDSKT